MSTNYYYVKKPYKACGHAPGPVHLGKSSVGWCFSLHVMPECGITDFPEMVDWLQQELGEFQRPTQDYPRIEDEYGDVVSFEDFLHLVINRDNSYRIARGWDWKWYNSYYESEQDFHDCNFSERGPNGLLRHQVDGVHCLGHGEGTWDLIAGDFS